MFLAYANIETSALKKIHEVERVARPASKLTNPTQFILPHRIKILLAGILKVNTIKAKDKGRKIFSI
jgi:hypothetical protein